MNKKYTSVERNISSVERNICYTGGSEVKIDIRLSINT